MILLKPKPRKSSESGYSLIESLIAIIVVSVLMVSVAPMIALSVGTRAQARRLELASQAGRAYVDFLRSNSGNVTEIVRYAPGNTTNTAPTQGDFVAGVEGYMNNNNRLFCVNFDENPGCQTNSLVDMVVQPVRLNNNNNPERGYDLLIRVYRADAFSQGTFQIEGQNSAITNAIGDRTAPMVQFSTSIGSVSENQKFQETRQRICNRIGGANCN